VRAGLPSFTIVGLGDRSVREARERVHAAILNSGFEFPARRVTVNLAPAYLRKAGPGFDLAIAAGVLAASGQLPADALERSPSSASLRSAASCARAAACSPVAEGTLRAGLDGLVVPRERAAGGHARRRASTSSRRTRSPRSRPSCAAATGRHRRPEPNVTALRPPDPGGGPSPTCRGQADVIGALTDRRGRRAQHAAVGPAGRRQDHDPPAACPPSSRAHGAAEALEVHADPQHRGLHAGGA
jgi:hypothetical protein